mmetsp:Transcript_3443/g.5730  ORF Transcript_3443/g.5730 Transcript_3443/m.5730 type:complete len:379 (+) Transcript_3443:40-1176(+)
MAGEAFAFNFQLSPDGDEPTADDSTTAPRLSAQQQLSPKSQLPPPPAARIRKFSFMEGVKEMIIEKSLQRLESDELLTLSDGHSLRKVVVSSSTRVATTTAQQSSSSSSDEAIYNELEKQGTDIIPGTYEGGLKVWECSLDLCRYLSDHRDTLKQPSFAMELGCGHGLPLCCILRNGLASTTTTTNGSIITTKVLFADFNDFVLKDVTMANILLNTEGHSVEEVAASVVFGAGDWLAMSTQLEQNAAELANGAQQQQQPLLPSNGRFDLILAAETTYTAEAAAETAMLLSKHLAAKDSVGLVATKRYYFGCGGGSDAFRTAANACQASIIEGCSYDLSVETVEVFDDGSGNIRELLKVTLLEQQSGVVATSELHQLPA